MVEAGEKPLVTVTGVTGFLGVQTALKFFEDGGFRVRGTVRSKTNEAKINPIKKTLGAFFDQLELVEADLLDKQSMIAAVAGSTYVAHTASPFVLGVSQEDKDKLIKPAVDGTLAVLEGAKAAGVKRVVITSSLVATQARGDDDKPEVWKEEHWSDPDRPGGLNPYIASKYYAEKAAWKFIEELPEGEKIDLVTVLPCMILGPADMTEAFTSGQLFTGMLLGKPNPNPRSCMGIVDVRDVAAAHVKGITVEEAKGHRIFTWNGSHWRNDLAKILAGEFAKDGWPICTEEGPDTGATKSKIDVSPFTDILGLQYTPVENTIIDMARSMIDSGFVKKPE